MAKLRSSTKLKTRMARAAKTRSKRVHVTSRANGWVVKKEGNKRASTGVIRTQEGAIKEANRMKKDGKVSAVIIHSKNGKIRR